MRVAILISLGALGWFSVARADEPFPSVTLGDNTGYIIPEKYASDHKTDLVASLPGYGKIDGFWTPTEQEITVAARTLHELLASAVKNPALLFPDLAQNENPPPPDSPDSLQHQQKELALVVRNENAYARQFVGIILEGRKVIFCNYAIVPKADPSTGYLFIQKSFTDNGAVHFLQGRFDPESKTCSNVAMIGSWQPKPK